MNLKLLAEPFAPSDIEWRVGRAGVKDDKVWASVLAYITNRAIMQRLDDVCGPANWRNEYRHEANGAVLCGISILVPRNADEWGAPEWVTKWDGAENTDIEAVKGGLSNAMKRAAVQWGIGRYLYDLEEGYAKVHAGGAHYAAKNDKKGIPAFKWDPPALPKWALPGAVPAPQPVAEPAPQAKQDRVAKADQGLMLSGRRMATMTDVELLRVISEKATDRRYVKHVEEAKALLEARRDPDVAVKRMIDAVDKESLQLS